MLELASIAEITKTLKWIITLSASEIKDIKNNVNELIADLSESLVSLWDVVSEVTNINDDEFTKDSFDVMYDYFFKFYLGDWNIKRARTHCSKVNRTTGKIKFKVSKFLHTDLGKWDEMDEKLKLITMIDDNILDEYDKSIKKIDTELKNVKRLLEENNLESANQAYRSIKTGLEKDLYTLRSGVTIMEEALDHVSNVSG